MGFLPKKKAFRLLIKWLVFPVPMQLSLIESVLSQNITGYLLLLPIMAFHMISYSIYTFYNTKNNHCVRKAFPDQSCLRRGGHFRQGIASIFLALLILPLLSAFAE